MIGCKPLSENDIETIMNNLKGARNRALFTLMLNTGFRIQEVLSLKVSDICEDRVKVSRKNMKGQVSSRSVFLNDKARTSINELIKEESLESHNFLFKSLKGDNSPITRVQAWRILKSIVRAHALSDKIALHSTRKTFADKAYKAFDRDLIKTSKALGHKSILSTASYLSFNTEEIDEFVKGL